MGEDGIGNHLAFPFATVDTGDRSQFPGCRLLTTCVTRCFPIDNDSFATLFLSIMRHWMMMVQHEPPSRNRTLALRPGFLPRSWPRDTYISVLCQSLAFEAPATRNPRSEKTPRGWTLPIGTFWDDRGGIYCAVRVDPR
jgi:hypothetical protein